MFHLFQKWHSQSLPLYLNTGSKAACDKNAEFTWISLRPLGNETDVIGRWVKKEVMIVRGAIVNHNTHYSHGPTLPQDTASHVCPLKETVYHKAGFD